MQNKVIKWLSALLAGLMLLGCFTACGEPNEDGKETKPAGDTAGADESETKDAAQEALDALEGINWGGEDFAVLYSDRFKDEVVGVNETVDTEGGSSQVINDAVYERNSLLEDFCKLKFTYVEKGDVEVNTMIGNEAVAPTGDFQLIDATLRNTAAMATNGYLYDLNKMDVNLEGEWWDSGTADFVLNDGVYFMSGSLNIGDDKVTYVMIFNKQMRATYANTIPNPYDTVRAKEWTLDYFNEIIQGVSADNGDGKWDELDTYGFLTTWEYGNTFFLASDLRYVLNDETVDEPTLYLSEAGRMDKALKVLETAQRIYHDNNASFMSPPGEEDKGVTAFKENRGLFFGEVVAHLQTLNSEMVGEYGIVPVPKYDKAQENYRTWTHDSGSTFSVTSAIEESKTETVGDILEVYAILSHQYLKPAYYDIVLTSRNLRDADSAEMMDIIFSNRVYDMSFYFDLGFYDLFKSSVNDKKPFTSTYEKSAKPKMFSKKIQNLLQKLK